MSLKLCFVSSDTYDYQTVSYTFLYLVEFWKVMLNYAEKLVTLKCKCNFKYEGLEKIKDTVFKLTSGRITSLRHEIQKS